METDTELTGVLTCEICQASNERADCQSITNWLVKENVTVSYFLTRNEIIGHSDHGYDSKESFHSIGSVVCAKCYALIEYCDHLHGVYSDTIDQLKNRRLFNSTERQPDASPDLYVLCDAEKLINGDVSCDSDDAHQPEFPETVTEEENVEKPAVKRRKLKCRHCSFGTTKKITMCLHRRSAHHLSPATLDPETRDKLLHDIRTQSRAPYVNMERLPVGIEASTKPYPRNEKGEYICYLCSEGFATTLMLRLHRNRVHNIKLPFACNICGKDFNQNRALTKHMETHPSKNHTSKKRYPRNEKGELICDICSQTFTKRSVLRSHRSRVHNMKFKLLCTICGKDFNQNSALRLHMEMHDKRVRYNCNKCEKKFLSYSTYRGHMQYGCGNKRMFPCMVPTPCELCGELVKLTLLPHHKKYKCPAGERATSPRPLNNPKVTRKKKAEANINENTNGKSLLCEFCGKDLKTVNQRQHFVVRNGVKTCRVTTRKPKQCPHCPKVYISIVKLNEHLENHHGIIVPHDDKKVGCPNCEKKFVQKTNMAAHAYNDHGLTIPGVKQHQCLHCGMIFFSTGKLNDHINWKHTKNVQRHYCDVCDFSTIYINNLNSHKKIHLK